VSDNKAPYVLENEHGTMGTIDYLYLFMTLEAAQRYADKYPESNWKARRIDGGFKDVSS